MLNDILVVPLYKWYEMTRFTELNQMIATKHSCVFQDQIYTHACKQIQINFYILFS